ncbi:conserved exported hypothetical protein [uncultured Paludibacter sp.]|nr:conserved exported hypothetical protein [uncultured Paludibacter sp.]
MKRLTFIIHFLIVFTIIVSAQSKGQVIDDVYLTPNDEMMIKKTEPESKKEDQRPVYKNGAREIVFIDQNGNRTNIVSDTVYVVDNATDSLAVDSLEEEGYYLNGFKGSQSDLEYAERIRRFHHPRYAIFIGDPRYNDIYFLDNYDWNVYIDGSYAYVTPTWTNPYWWNYNFSPYSSWNWGLSWGSYWGSPYWSSYYGWGGWYNPWYTNYWGYYGYPYYGGYYGYGWGYPYYGGYYGGGYPYYGGYYGYSYDKGADNSYRRSTSTYDGRSTLNSSNSSRRMNTMGGERSGNPYTVVSRTRSSAATSYNRENSTVTSGSRPVRSSYTGAGTYSTRTDRSSGVINRTSSSGNYNSSRGSNSSSSDSRSRQTYSTPSRSSSTYESNRSSGSYSSGSRSSGSSGGSYSSGSSSGSSRSSSGSSTSGGRR